MRMEMLATMRGLVLAACTLACCATGCFKAPAPTMMQEQRGLVWMFPGIGGGAWYLEGAYRGFRDAGVDAEICINEWDTPFYNALGHLTEIAENRRQAAAAAEKIEKYWHDHPGARIDLVGYSAGGGMALLVTEALPPDVRVNNLVLVQAAVSPTHDLTTALQRVDGHIVNLYSEFDWFVLGLGTGALGTVDREHVASAGKNGFNLDVAVPDEALRVKVEQHRWGPEMIWVGHLGNHASILLYAWNKKYVAPYLPRKDNAATNPPCSQRQ